MSDKIVNKAFLDVVLKNPWRTTPIDAKTMAETILAERAERAKNPGVWDGAPDEAVELWIEFSGERYLEPLRVHHTRELPKTRAREKAEAAICKYFSKHEGNLPVTVEELASLLESVYAESIK